ncbi:hypothetical protein GCM10007304_22610 [Rhodococcoides trifolii]|uniref:Uncharacterized protein n=1 Tax=Rhodococcoides trifolii TaxID=908250 RepID=A0A917D2E1_9NOCA|nr:hypothetical protein [Rhodococcus trifolii]GGG07999.1 hypothetical protein GCM10007304_22610 [Rhodococcus trifolii]
MARSDFGDSVAGAARPVIDFVRSRADPRKKEIRRRRRTRRKASFFGAASGSTAVGTAAVAVASAPEWLVVTGGGAAAVFAVPAVLAVSRYRRMRGVPLPPAKPRKRALPPWGSAARAPMMRLTGAEQSLHHLLAMVARSGAIATGDLDDTARIASGAAESLDQVAVDIVEMERAAQGSPRAAEHLATSIDAAVEELDQGVDQFDELVAAAAQLTSPGVSGPDTRRDALLFASDRLRGFAYALDELRP